MNEHYRRTVATNRKARYEYHIEQELEAGIVLVGTEVKALREGKCSFQDSYAAIADDGNRVLLHSLHIAHYGHGNLQNHEPTRSRVLLLHKQEIDKLRGKIAERGYTLIPLEVYFSGSLVKVKLGLARGKRQYDKREVIKEREQRREAESQMKEGRYR